MTYDDAVRALYEVEHERFVAERKRLAGELRAAGDRAGAAKLGKVARPPVSAWVVNQLYRHARDAYDVLLAAAARVRDGDLSATGAHRDALATLRRRAVVMLGDAAHGATEATLRRVAANLAAIAAVGGFDPDLPGALAGDRAPPGFETLGAMAVPAAEAASEAEAEAESESVAEAETESEAETAAAAAAAAAAEAQRRADEQRAARRRAERERVAAALRTARGEVESGERRVRALERDLDDARTALAKLHAIADDLARSLAGLDEGA